MGKISLPLSLYSLLSSRVLHYILFLLPIVILLVLASLSPFLLSLRIFLLLLSCILLSLLLICPDSLLDVLVLVLLSQTVQMGYLFFVSFFSFFLFFLFFLLAAPWFSRSMLACSWFSCACFEKLAFLTSSSCASLQAP